MVYIIRHKYNVTYTKLSLTYVKPIQDNTDGVIQLESNATEVITLEDSLSQANLLIENVRF